MRKSCFPITRNPRHPSTELSVIGPELIVSSFDNFDSSVLTAIHGDPSDYIRIGKIYTWRITRKQWHWSTMEVDYENSRLFLVDKMDKLVTASGGLVCGGGYAGRAGFSNPGGKGMQIV